MKNWSTYLGLGLISAAGVYLVFLLIERLSLLLLPLDVAPMVAVPVQFGLIVTVFGLLFLLLFLRRGIRDKTGRAFFSGVVFGGLITMTGAYPIITLVLSKRASGFLFIGTTHRLLLPTTLFVSLLLLLSMGPLTVQITRVQRRKDRLWVGAVATVVAALVLFGLLGHAVAGILAHAPLFGVASTRLGYGENEWPLKLIQAVNRTMPFTLLLFWGLLSAAGLSGALMALLFGKPQETATNPGRLTAWPWGVIVMLFPFLMILSQLNIAVFSLLSEQIMSTFAQYNTDPLWKPNFTAFLLYLQPFCSGVFVFLLGLIWLWRLPRTPQFGKAGGCLGYWLGGIGIGLSVLAYLIAPGYQSFYVLIFGLSVLMLFLARRSAAQENMSQSTLSSQPRLPEADSWIIACGIGGFLTAVLYHFSWAYGLNLVLLGVALVPELDAFITPAPGLAWLAEILHQLIVTQAWSFLMFTLGGGAVGAFIGWYIARWIPSDGTRF